MPLHCYVSLHTKYFTKLEHDFPTLQLAYPPSSKKHGPTTLVSVNADATAILSFNLPERMHGLVPEYSNVRILHLGVLPSKHILLLVVTLPDSSWLIRKMRYG